MSPPDSLITEKSAQEHAGARTPMGWDTDACRACRHRGQDGRPAPRPSIPSQPRRPGAGAPGAGSGPSRGLSLCRRLPPPCGLTRSLHVSVSRYVLPVRTPVPLDQHPRPAPRDITLLISSRQTWSRGGGLGLGCHARCMGGTPFSPSQLLAPLLSSDHGVFFLRMKASSLSGRPAGREQVSAASAEQGLRRQPGFWWTGSAFRLQPPVCIPDGVSYEFIALPRQRGAPACTHPTRENV